MQRLLFVKDEYIELPESWEEVSFKKFLDLSECDNVDLSAVAVLTGVNKEDWAKSNNVSLYYYCMNELSKWVTKGIVDMNNREVKRLEFLSKNIEFADLAEQSVAQYEDLKILLDKYQKLYESKPFEAMRLYYPLMASIYLQPKVNSEQYNYEKAQSYVTDIMELPAPVVIGVVNFFLTKFVASRIGISNNVQMASSRWKRWKQGFQNYIKRLVFRQFLTAWQKGTLRKRITLKG